MKQPKPCGMCPACAGGACDAWVLVTAIPTPASSPSGVGRAREVLRRKMGECGVDGTVFDIIWECEVEPILAAHSSAQAHGEPVTLAECPIGLFWCDGELCLKTEYHRENGAVEAYIVSSGECFWGPPPQTVESVNACLVVPCAWPPTQAQGEATTFTDRKIALPNDREAVRTYLQAVADHDATLPSAPSEQMVDEVWRLCNEVRVLGSVMPLAVIAHERGESYRRLRDTHPTPAPTQEECPGCMGPCGNCDHQPAAPPRKDPNRYQVINDFAALIGREPTLTEVLALGFGKGDARRKQK